MKFVDLNCQYEKIKTDVNKRIQKVLEHGQYVMGPELYELEEKLADYVGVKHCMGVASGTAALCIAMKALGIGEGDEVITTPFTFIATAEIILLLGAKPVFIDIDPRTYNLDISQIESAITSKTKAIMPVSLYGQCPDFDAINAIAKQYNLPVIEDAAQSLGATYKDKYSCNLSTIGCTSFFPSKPLGGYGDSGACFTNDDELAKTMREIRVHGQDKHYHHAHVGINGRLDTLQAAILLAKMEIFPEEIKLRQKIGEQYTSLLKDHCITPHIEPFNTSVYAQYTIQVENREKVQMKLKEADIPTAIHYPIPLYRQPILINSLTPDKNIFPQTELATKRVISLPMHPYLSKEEITKIAEKVIETL